MIGPLEKGLKAAATAAPPQGSYGGVDLTVLPQYISYRAALLKEKMTLQYVVTLVSATFVIYFGISRYEIHSLYQALREKEFILAPGVQDFLPVSPQRVSDRYIQHAVTDIINQLGNINPVNVEEQYQSLSELMSPQLRTKFLAEAQEWLGKVKQEQISEILTIQDKSLAQVKDNTYRVIANVKVDTFIRSQTLGYRDEVVEMSLELSPPSIGRRWFLEVTSLARLSAEAYQARNKVTGSLNHEK